MREVLVSALSAAETASREVLTLVNTMVSEKHGI